MIAVASDVRVQVVSNREISPGYFSMRLRGPASLARFRPGQFLMLGWAEGLDPFLPRAMSIRSAECGVRSAECEVEILYKIYGRGTALLAEMGRGRWLRALGPLGNAFEVPRSARKLLLVAGGIGVPPIVALAEALSNRRSSQALENIVLLGGKSKPDLLCIADFRRTGSAVHVATEDGSAGFKGLVTQLVNEYLSTPHPAPRTPHSNRSTPHPRLRTPHPVPRTFLYACGPHQMLAALAPIAEKYDLQYQASLEANMACGFGACMGCVMPVAGGEGHQTYQLVCRNGPVFDGRQILWTNNG